MNFINDWVDLGRVAMIVLSLWCCYTLIQKYRKNNEQWTTKTKDYWFALLMWAIAGAVTMTQGILLDRPLTPATVVIVAAVLVTGKGLNQKGAWGGDDE